MGGPKPNKDVNALGRVGQGQQQALQGNIMGGLTGAQGRSDQVFNTAFGGYQNLLSGLQNPQTGGGGGGGVNPGMAALAGIQGPGSGIGGITGMMRARNDSLLPGFFDRIRSEQERLQNVQGGYNPGYTAQLSKIARESAQEGASAKLKSELEIAKMQQAAKAAQANFELQRAGMMMRGGGGGGGGSADDSFRQQMAVLGAMGGLREQTPGEAGMYMGGALQNVGLGNQQFGQFAGYNPPSVPAWQRALGAAGQVAGAFF